MNKQGNPPPGERQGDRAQLNGPRSEEIVTGRLWKELAWTLSGNWGRDERERKAESSG